MQLNDKALDAFMRSMDRATDMAVARAVAPLKEALRDIGAIVASDESDHQRLESIRIRLMALGISEK